MWLASLLVSHPLYKPVCICMQWQAKQHLSHIHLLLHTYDIDPSKCETCAPASRLPNSMHSILTDIASSREESKEADTEDSTTLKVYTDGLGQDGMVGAATVLYKGNVITGMLQYYLGSLEQHTTFEAELIGILLGLWLLHREPDADSVSPKANSQVAIQALNMHRLGPGSHILDEIHELSESLCINSISDLQLRVSWISGHDGVAGNESIDKEAKAAAKGDLSPCHKLPSLLQSNPLPFSTKAIKQHFRVKLAKEWHMLWEKSPHYQHASKIDPKLPARSFLKLTREVSKSQASTVFQLRSKHVLLCKHLHRIGKVDSPLCTSCGHGEETMHYFLFECPTHEHARFKLGHKFGQLSQSLRHILGSQKALKPLLLYVRETERF